MADRRTVINDVENEVLRALELYPEPFNSPHEGWAVTKEELDELWAEVMKKPVKRDKSKLYDEAIQVAAMAVRFALECCE